MKQFVVIGLGNFGFNVAQFLTSKGHQVLAIDCDQQKVDEISDFVTDAVVTDVKNFKVLKEFITPKIDAAIISTGQNLEASILVTHYLKDLKINHIIVKAVDENHAKILELMGADEIIRPERDMALFLAQRLTTPNLVEHIPLTAEYSIVEITAPEKYFGKSLRDIQLRAKFNLLVIAVRNILTDSLTLMPAADFIIKPDVILVIMGKMKDLDNFKL